MSAADLTTAPAEAEKGRAGGHLGPVALTALAVAAFLLALGGALWAIAGEAVFRAMAEAGATILCL